MTVSIEQKVTEQLTCEHAWTTKGSVCFQLVLIQTRKLNNESQEWPTITHNWNTKGNLPLRVHKSKSNVWLENKTDNRNCEAQSITMGNYSFERLTDNVQLCLVPWCTWILYDIRMGPTLRKTKDKRIPWKGQLY